MNEFYLIDKNLSSPTWTAYVGVDFDSDPLLFIEYLSKGQNLSELSEKLFLFSPKKYSFLEYYLEKDLSHYTKCFK